MVIRMGRTAVSPVMIVSGSVLHEKMMQMPFQPASLCGGGEVYARGGMFQAQSRADRGRISLGRCVPL